MFNNFLVYILLTNKIINTRDVIIKEHLINDDSYIDQDWFDLNKPIEYSSENYLLNKDNNTTRQPIAKSYNKVINNNNINTDNITDPDDLNQDYYNNSNNINVRRSKRL